MPSLTPAELQAARRASGRLGGRPRKPTVSEARPEDESDPQRDQRAGVSIGNTSEDADGEE